MSFRAMSYGAAVAVVLLLAINGCQADFAPVDKLVAHKLTDAAFPCIGNFFGPQNPCSNPKLPKYKKVPYFPGTKFFTSPCGNHGHDDRTITVTAYELTYSANAGQGHPYALNIRYIFKTADLIINTFQDPKSPVTTSAWSLSALLDSGSVGGPNPAGYYATIYRQAAIETLGIIIGELAAFAKKNRQCVCCNVNVYNPKVANLVAYFKTVQAILKNF